LIASWVSSLDLWEYFEYSATAIVFVAAAGECCAEFTKWPQRRGIKERLAKLSTLVLVIALAGELLGVVRTSQLSGQLIASLEKQASEAAKETESLRKDTMGFSVQLSITKKDAADANERAKKYEAGIAESNARAKGAEAQVASANATAQEAIARTKAGEVERLKLQAIVSPRSLSLEQQRSVASALTSFAGRRVTVATYSLDAERAILGKQIAAALGAAKINVDDRTASLMPLGGFSLGVHVSESEADLVAAISLALASIGRLAVAPPNSTQTGGASIGVGDSSSAPVSILVGVKPVAMVER
jgi:hypothetical protein